MRRANGRSLVTNMQATGGSDSSSSDSRIVASELVKNLMKNASFMQYNPLSSTWTKQRRVIYSCSLLH
jgi:hypothetical protein